MHPSLKALIYRGLKHCKQSRFHYNLRWLVQTQFQPASILHAEQEKLLIYLLNQANTGVPAYQERFENAGLFQQDTVQLENFHRIAPLVRTDLAFQCNAFVHQQADETDLTYAHTGGSTGTPVKIAQNAYYRDWAQAATSLYYLWSEMTVGKPYFLLWAAYQDLQAQLTCKKEQFVVGFLQGRRILNCRVTSPERMSGFIDTLNQQTDCQYMVGYANELYALACYSLENNKPLNRPFKAVYATAATLTEAMRQTIESVFKCRVYNRYGCRDAGDIACECEYQNGLHINPLYAYVEVTDEVGNPLSYGQEGQILVTSLHNYVMPLIRYAVGDQGILKPPHTCACGRTWPTLAFVTGRVSEKLYLPNGTRFGGACLHTAFEDLPFLQGYQIHQYAPDQLVIRLRSPVPHYMMIYQGELARVVQRLQAWSGTLLSVQFEQSEMFEKTPTGKELMIVHHMPLPHTTESLIR